jgi:hypothetical protein
MSSVQELEERNTYEKEILMRVYFNFLVQNGVKAELTREPATNSLEMPIQESVIHMKEHKVDRIRLAGSDGAGCGGPDSVTRFHYEINPDRELSPQQMKDINTVTDLIKEGKVLSFFGGKVVEVKWVGKSLAEALNNDKEIADNLLNCAKSWSHLDYNIGAVSPKEVYINGPRFINPGQIAQLFESNLKEEIKSCVFNYQTIEKIAGYIKDTRLLA